MDYVGGMHLRNMARTRRYIQPLEAVERQRHLRTDDGRTGSRARREEDGDDRCDLSEGPSHRVQPGREKKGRGRLIGRTKGGMNTKLHAICDGKGRPIKFFMSAGQVSDYTGAAALLSSLPEAEWLLADRGYDADWYREALHPGPEVPRQARQIRQAPLQAAQSYRDHVRQAQGLAPRRDPL